VLKERGFSREKGERLKVEIFYGTQYHRVPPVEKDSYVIEKKHICKDLTVEINFVPPVFLVWYGWYS
jgi:hypothetical protein